VFDFLRLVANENMKIYRRVRTWVMLAILLALAFAIPAIAAAMDAQVSMWNMMLQETEILFGLVTIFTVVVSADSVAGEFSSGTIKLLLIRPWSRSKILLSKYIALIQFALFFAAVLFVSLLVFDLLFMGADPDFRAPSRPDWSPYAYMLAYYGNEFVSLLIVVTLSFMLSTVFRSGGLAIGLSMFVLFAGSIITGILSSFDYEWVKYVLFIHLNLNMYLAGAGSPVEGVTAAFSVAALGIYYFLFVAITWVLFNKRDVAA